MFVLFKAKEHLKLFVNYMNSKHKNIKFTFETEDSNNFSFVDVKITHENKRFVTSIFHKATSSGIFTNSNSFIFDSYKSTRFCSGFSKFIPVWKNLPYLIIPQMICNYLIYIFIKNINIMLEAVILDNGKGSRKLGIKLIIP